MFDCPKCDEQWILEQKNVQPFPLRDTIDKSIDSLLKSNEAKKTMGALKALWNKTNE